MRFFVPHIAHAADAENVRDATKAFLKDQGYPTTDRRIARFEFREEATNHIVEVGKALPDLGEEVLIILEGAGSNLLFACTLTRGVTQGGPCVIPRKHASSISDFEI